MSKAFTNEEAPDDVVLVPARAPLPDGVKNYVTPRGLALLRAEREALLAERSAVLTAPAATADRAARLTVLDGRLAELDGRLRSGQVVVHRGAPPAEARFGATVTLRADDGEIRRYTIVGVDEADAAAGLVAFTAPLARAVVGRKPGDVVRVPTAHGEEPLTVEAVTYGAG